MQRVLTRSPYIPVFAHVAPDGDIDGEGLKIAISSRRRSQFDGSPPIPFEWVPKPTRAADRRDRRVMQHTHHIPALRTTEQRSVLISTLLTSKKRVSIRKR